LAAPKATRVQSSRVQGLVRLLAAEVYSPPEGIYRDLT
jgi:hypothetical protein